MDVLVLFAKRMVSFASRLSPSGASPPIRGPEAKLRGWHTASAADGANAGAHTARTDHADGTTWHGPRGVARMECTCVGTKNDSLVPTFALFCTAIAWLERHCPNRPPTIDRVAASGSVQWRQ